VQLTQLGLWGATLTEIPRLPMFGSTVQRQFLVIRGAHDDEDAEASGFVVDDRQWVGS